MYDVIVITTTPAAIEEVREDNDVRGEQQMFDLYGRQIQAPAAGQLLWQVDVDDVSAAPVAGTEVKAGEACGYVQTKYGMEGIIPAISGRIVAVTGKQGKKVEKGEIVAFVE